jgi:hypothetical protein
LKNWDRHLATQPFLDHDAFRFGASPIFQQPVEPQAVVLYQLHASGAARVTSYCSQLASAATAQWDHDRRRTAGIRPGMPLA